MKNKIGYVFCVLGGIGVGLLLGGLSSEPAYSPEELEHVRLKCEVEIESGAYEKAMVDMMEIISRDSPVVAPELRAYWDERIQEKELERRERVKNRLEELDPEALHSWIERQRELEQNPKPFQIAWTLHALRAVDMGYSPGDLSFELMVWESRVSDYERASRENG